MPLIERGVLAPAQLCPLLARTLRAGIEYRLRTDAIGPGEDLLAFVEVVESEAQRFADAMRQRFPHDPAAALRIDPAISRDCSCAGDLCPRDGCGDTDRTELAVRDVARLLALGERQVRNLAATGVLLAWRAPGGRREWRFDSAQVQAWAAQRGTRHDGIA